ncbi:MAG: ABC transporter permease [bacterium]
MKIPLKYSFRNFLTRRLTNAVTVIGIALVVFVFAAVLMMAYGIRKTLVATGSADNVLIARKAANGEISSIVSRDDFNTILTLPHVARTAEGKPLVTSDVVVIINQNKFSGGISNLTVRGVSPEAFAVRSQVIMAEGRAYNAGAREIIVGSAVRKTFLGTNLGDEVTLGGDRWKIVGVFDAGGSGFDSEMWCDVDQLADAFNRQGAYSTITFKLDRPDSFDELKRAFDNEQRLQQYEPKIEQRFFEEQSEAMSLFISALGLFITVIFSVGATIGAMITMYAAVANRTVEIGTLRALGFRRRSVLASFLMESVLLGLIGGLLGLGLASFLQFVSFSTLNFGSFSELSFSFALSPAIILITLSFALAMGFFGGFLPAVRAARLNIVNALRSS